MLVERGASEQPRDRRVGVGAPAEREPDQRGNRPPGDRQQRQQRRRASEDREHGDQREHSGHASAEQDCRLEELGEAHRYGERVGVTDGPWTTGSREAPLQQTPRAGGAHRRGHRSSRSASSTSSRGASSERTATHTAHVSFPACTSERSPRKASRSVVSSPTYSAACSSGWVLARPSSSAVTPSPLSSATGDAPRAPCGPNARQSPPARRARRSPARRLSAAASSGAPRQWKAAIASLSSTRTRRR